MASLRRSWLLAVAALIVLALFVAAPPGRRDTRPSPASIGAPALARGVVHVHTMRSDGSGTVDDVAAAASRAGLQFVVLSDHGDGTRAPLPPAYRAGVLILDGVEISTAGGHYVALGLGEMPYRLAGEPVDVAEDVRRLGGFGLAAHPDSPKAELAWRDWQAPIDGLEWFNLDSEWRDESAATLARALAFYPVRRLASLASLVGDGGSLLPRWAELAATRRTVGLAAVDAHARLGTEGGFEGSWVNLRIPSYDTLFATAQVSVELDGPLSRDAARDADAILGGLREGRSFSTIAARAEAGRVALAATRGPARARMGGFLGGDAAPVVTVEADAPAGAVIRIVCDGRTITQTFAGATFSRVLEPGEMGRACQAVVGWPGSSPDRFVTWAVTNPIYWRSADVTPAPAVHVAGRSEVLAAAPTAWVVEHNGSEATIAPAASSASTEPAVAPVTLTYALAPGARAGQYAALVTSDIGTLGWAQWLRLRLQADRPMRVSLQVRRPAGQGAQRWQRSLVVGPEPTTHVVPIASLSPLDGASGPPPATEVRSLLLVVDTINTPPGRRGSVTVHEVRAEAP